MSEPEEDKTETSDTASAPLNRAERRALAAGKNKPGNDALVNGLRQGHNRNTAPPAQRIQTRGAGRGK